MEHLRLPIRGLSLKDVASYFDLSDTAHGISAGDEAVDIYLRARAYRSKERRNRARATLEAYNADDLASLAKLIETLRGRYPQDQYIPPEPKPTRERRSTKDFWRSLTITTVPAEEDDLVPRACMDDDDTTAF